MFSLFCKKKARLHQNYNIISMWHCCKHKQKDTYLIKKKLEAPQEKIIVQLLKMHTFFWPLLIAMSVICDMAVFKCCSSVQPLDLVHQVELKNQLSLGLQ